MKKLVIIGGGVMGNIFAQALSQNYRVTTCDKDEDKKICLDADIILFAVKPQSFAKVIQELQGNLTDPLIISIMAGVPIDQIAQSLGVKKIVRAMPNLGARVGKSMTVWTCSLEAKYDKDEINNLFKQVGEILYVENEDIINKATAVSGSGPGFFYYLISEWIKAAEELGFSQADTKLLLLTTIDGANSVLQNEKDPQYLTTQVASKGGTTQAGLDILEKHNLKEMFVKVMQSAEKRANELAK